MSSNTPSAQQADFPRKKVRYYAALCPKLQYGKSNSARLALVSAGGAGGRMTPDISQEPYRAGGVPKQVKMRCSA